MARAAAEPAKGAAPIVPARAPTKRPSRERKALRAELLRCAEEMLAKLQPAPGFEWAVRYLESSRLLGMPPAPTSAADQAKLAQVQADEIVDAIATVLDGLHLSDEERDRGFDLAVEALTAASSEGWQPL
jgi:hypothetical protein